jgi:hypothetical protein
VAQVNTSYSTNFVARFYSAWYRHLLVAQIDSHHLQTLQNKTLQQGWWNMMYSAVPPVTLGVEYIYGERKTFNGQKGKDNRVGAMARYNF